MNRVVWHLCSNRWNSAITEYALSAARALSLSGDTQTFFALKNSPAAQRAKNYLSTLEVPSFSLSLIFYLGRLFFSTRPHIVVTYGGPETVLAQIFKLFFKFKLYRFRGYEIPEHASGLQFQISHMGVDGIIAPSQGIARRMKHLIPFKPVEVVPLGVDQDKFKRAAFRPSILEAEFLIVGRFDPVKGHAEFLKIWKKFTQRREGRLPKPMLHIIGEAANLSQDYIKIAVSEAGLKLDRDVKLTFGRHPNLPDAMSKAAVGVISSLGSEIICRVAEEFLLCGTPVMVSGVGSLGEVMFENAGFNYGGSSEKELLDQMEIWLEKGFHEADDDKIKRSQMALEIFSLPAMGKVLEKVLAR